MIQGRLFPPIIKAAFLAFASLSLFFGALRVAFENAKENLTSTKQHPVVLFNPFNETNPHPSFCPKASCYNSPICSPCNRRYLFILATPRSGSTTLLATLNALPGVRLSGENPEAFIKLWTLMGGKEKIGDKRMTNLLNSDKDEPEGAHRHNAIPKQAMACTAQQFMNTINPPPLSVQQNAHVLPLSQYDNTTILGSKMIRVQRGDWSRSLNHGPRRAAKFIKTYFPCSKVVVNVRKNLEDQLSSINTTFVARHHVVNETDLLREKRFLKDLAWELGEEQAKVTFLENWSKNKRYMNNLIKWIGFEGCDVKRIPHNNKGNNGYEQDKKTSSVFKPSCKYLHA